MPDQLKSGVENLSGMSMDSVKVHYNSDKPGELRKGAVTEVGISTLGTALIPLYA